MLIADAEIEAGARPLDVRIGAGRIAEIGTTLTRRGGEPVVEAGGGALLPGLHDHHIHLLALAAAERSVRCGPPDVDGREALRAALAAGAVTGGWVRGVGYHESVAGDLDRVALDELAPERPVRVQHRSGALWVLNSRGVEEVGLERSEDAPGVERDATGRATGRLYHLDAWLRARLPSPNATPDLAPAGRRLARYGVTGVTDATPTNGPDELRAFQRGADDGALPQRVVAMGGEALPSSTHRRVERGPVKIYLAERDLPRFDELRRRVSDAHDGSRGVAFHCVTRAELVLACASVEAAGARVGDRIEHAGIAPPDVLPLLAKLGLTVVTQPGFVLERGDAYLDDVDPADRPWLYRARGLLEAGIPVGGSTDAPFGSADPWRAMRAAVERRTRRGAHLGRDERVSPEQALALFTTPPERPGGMPRRIAVGEPADLCLLDRPWCEARRALSSAHVALTLCDGDPVWGAISEAH